MSGFILGEKSKQTQFFNEAGDRIPTTFIKTTPCYLIAVKSSSQKGEQSAQLGFGQTKNIKKSVAGQLKKAGIKTPLRFLREFQLHDISLIEDKEKKGIVYGEVKILVGDEIKPTLFFKKGDKVNVAGISKGKGFQGVVKRHHFKGGSHTHGQSDRERAPGSIGQTTTPGRVLKNKRMAGRMGGERVTIKGLEVIDVKDIGLTIKGLVPGSEGGLLEIIKK